MKSTEVFHQQMVKAFPKLTEGELEWVLDPADAVKRLEVLFDIGDLKESPFWCLRGIHSAQVDEFRSPGSLQLDFGLGRITVQKLAAYRGRDTFRDFVYVDADFPPAFENFFLAGPSSPYKTNNPDLQELMKETLDALVAGKVTLEQWLPHLIKLPLHPEEQKDDEEK